MTDSRKHDGLQPLIALVVLCEEMLTKKGVDGYFPDIGAPLTWAIQSAVPLAKAALSQITSEPIEMRSQLRPLPKHDGWQNIATVTDETALAVLTTLFGSRWQRHTGFTLKAIVETANHNLEAALAQPLLTPPEGA